MTLRTLVPAVAVTALLLLTTSRDAHALGPLDLEVGARVGVGSNPDSNISNPLGLGIGGRAGVQIMGLYGGVSIIDYLGSDNGTYSDHALLYGIEAGFGFKLAILTIRPQIGVGNFTLTSSVDNTSFSGSTSALYLEPGVTALISLGLLYVGADINALIIPSIGVPSASASNAEVSASSSSTWTSVTIHGQVGLRF